MRTVFSYIFLTLHLLIYTEIHEILFAPVLIGHYNEHRTENEDLSFLDFLVYHYFSGHGTDPKEMHDGLPFNDTHANILGVGVPLPPSLEITNDSYVPVVHTCYTDPFILRSAQTTIWQPPRLS